MANFNFDLFSTSSSSSTSSGLFGINLSDYASIRNGSYRKLMKSYYKQEAEASGNSSSSSSSSDTKQSLTSIADSATSLKDSASKLMSKGKDALIQTKTDEKGNKYVDYDTDKVYKAAKDFVDNYNSLIDKVSYADNTSILRSTMNMIDYTAANESALSEIGITIGSDNQLSIDEEKFKSASKARVQSIFQSTGGYASQINAKASNIGIRANSAAGSAPSGTKVNSTSKWWSPASTSTSKDSAKTLTAIKEAAEDASDTLSTLRKTGTNNLFNKKSSGEYDVSGIYDAVKSFIKDYNALIDKTEDSNTKDISQARRTMKNYVSANKSSLSDVGITVDSDGKLSVDSDTFKSSDMSKVKSLFQGSSSLGGQLDAQISKISTYAELESSKSNTYSATGTYTNTYNSGNVYSSMI